MDTVESFNVPRELVEHIVHTQNNVSMVIMTQYELKPEKFESKVLVLNDCSLIITSTKIPCKVEQRFNLLNLNSLESKLSNRLNITAEGKHLSFLISDTDRIDSFLIKIIEALAVAFPKVPYQELIGPIKVEPSSREYHQHLQDMKARLDIQEPKPCGSFAASYRFMCNYLNQPHLPDVIWDIDTIYMFNNTKELHLEDFDHLDGRYLLPIIMALQYNEWFTSLNADGIKLLPEASNAISTVMRTNCCIKELHLSNLGLKSDFMQRLSAALTSNPNSALVHIDLSNNPIEDKGVSLLSAAISKQPKGLVHLNLSQTGITGRGVNKLTEALCSNQLICDTLDVLDLSQNSLKGEEVTNLFNFLAQPNSISYLNLMSTDCALDSIFGALQRGCCQKLRHLDLSQNSFFSKKSSKVSPSCKQFLGTAMALQHVNLSSCHLYGEAIKSVVLGLGCNPSCTNIELNISGNNLAQDIGILEMCLTEISSICSMDLSDNNLNNSAMSIITKLAKNKRIKKLSIGKNFVNMKPRAVGQMLGFLSEAIDEEDSVLESLSLAGSKLRGQLTILINALGTNSSLKELDISGNFMGDIGARMLAKALQVNTSLHTLYIDQNGITAQGFTDIARALERNFTLKSIPLPLSDVTMALKTNQPAVEIALKKIEAILQRNNSPKKFATDQCYRLQQSFLTNELQQIMDKAIAEIQNTANKLESMNVDSEDVLEDLTETHCLIKDASNSKQILTKFQMIAEKSESEDGKLCSYLKSVADKLQNAMDAELKNNIESMLECSSEQCPTLLENKDLYEEASITCNEKAQIPKRFTTDLVLEQLGADVFNKLGEVNLLIATCMSNLLIDSVESALRQSHKKLIHHLHVQEKTLVSDENKDSENKHASLLRRKNTEEETDYLDPNILSATKRKSVYSRKVRPESAVVNEMGDDVFTDSTDLTDGSTGSSPLNSRENTPSHEPPKHKFKKSKSSDKSLKLDIPLETGPRLEHLVKDRPRRPKNRPTTHVNNQPVVIDVLDKGSQEGIDGFFNSGTTQQPKSPNYSSEKDDSITKSSSKKKGWSPFSGKSAEKQSGFFSSKKSQSTKSPVAGNLKKGGHAVLPEVREVLGGQEGKDRSEVKDKPNNIERSQSHNGTYDHNGSRAEEDKERDDVEEPKPRRPPGHRLGIGIGGDALMAEMKAKRASKLPAAPKKSDSDDQSSNQSLMPPGGSSPSSPSPENRSVSPGLDEKSKPVPRSRHPPTVPRKPKPGMPATESKPAVVPVKPGGSDGTSHVKDGATESGGSTEVMSSESQNNDETTKEVYL